MVTGAIIVTAGSNNWQNKPRITLHTTTIVRKMVKTFLKADVGHIVVVAGANAEILYKHLSNLDVEIIYNENYKTSQMIDSAKLAWESLKDKCGQVLFTHGEVPMFMSLTVTELMESGAEVAIPVYHGLEGHPMLVSAPVFSRLLQWKEANGLRGAISSDKAKVTHVPVEDRGILTSVSTLQERAPFPDMDIAGKKLDLSDWGHAMRLEVSRGDATFGAEDAAFFRMIDHTGSIEEASVYTEGDLESAERLIAALKAALNMEIVERFGNDEKLQLTSRFRNFLNRWENFSKYSEKAITAIFEQHFQKP